MKRKFLIILLAVISVLTLSIGLVGCSGSGDSGNGDIGNGGNNGGNEQGEHSWGSWEVVREPTCTNTGLRQRTCLDHGEVQTEEIAKSDHDFNKNNICSVCNYELEFTTGLVYEEFTVKESNGRETSYYAVTGMGTATDKKIVIPAYHAGILVYKIADSAFNGKDAITSLYIANGVREIETKAFHYCISLLQVTLPESIDIIGARAFYNCQRLMKITMPSRGVTIGESAFSETAYYSDGKNWNSGVLYIGEHLISTNDSIPSSYTIKDGTKSIASYAFAGRIGLREITLSSSYRCGSDVFSGSGVTVADVDDSSISILPSSQITDLMVRGSGRESLSNFSSLKKLKYDETISYFSNGILSGCGSLEELSIPFIGFGGSWVSSGYYSDTGSPLGWLFGTKAFCGGVATTQYCYSSSESSGYTNRTYYIPSSLKTITITDNIGQYALSGCTMIKNLTFKSAVTEIGKGAFDNCTGLTDVYYMGDLVGWCGISFGSIRANPMLYATNLYFDGKLLSGNLVIPESITAIENYTFVNCAGLTSITMPDNVTSIGDRAFMRCTGLTSIKIPDSVTSIDLNAFVECSNLTYNEYGNAYYLGSNSNAYFALISSKEEGITSCTVHDNTKIIAGGAFTSSNLESITIPAGIISIGPRAFSYCYALTEINYNATECADLSPDNFVFANAGQWRDGITVIIGSNVKRIPAYLFRPDEKSTPSVVNVVFAEDSTCTSIGNDTFKECTRLTSITIPESVTFIGEGAFEGCTGLKSVYITDIAAWCNISFDDYESNPLCNAGNLYLNGARVTDLVIPNSVSLIGDHAFAYCGGLTSITIPDSVITIGESAFANCDELASMTIGDGVTSIGSSAFYGCSSLTSVVIGDSVETIGSYAFEKCSSLASVVIGDSVTTVGNSAFRYCRGLTSITIPDSVAFIGEEAFYGCSSLTYNEYDNAYYLGNEGNPYVVLIDAKSTDITSCMIHKETKVIYGAFSGCSGLTNITIPNSVSSIGDHAFAYCDGLTSIIIPDSVTSIDSSAFYDCSELASVTIGDGVTSIGNYAFSRCSSLTSVVMGDSVTSIGGSVFYGCSGLTSITIPDGVTSIGGEAFEACTGLTSITIPDSVTSIGGEAFYDCSSLTSISIPDNVTSIGGSAFYGCSSLTYNEYDNAYYLGNEESPYVVLIDAKSTDITSCMIHKETKVIYVNAFQGCCKLTSITIPDGVTTIGGGGFEGCTGLTSITIPDSVTSIGGSAFEDCRSLTSVVIGDSVAMIGESAFEDCISLTIVTIGNNVTSIGERAFSDCSSLTSITIPDSVTKIGEYAFYGCSNLTSVTFANTSGWRRVIWWSTATSGTSISSAELSNPATAAKYLTSTYCDYVWKRS